MFSYSSIKTNPESGNMYRNFYYQDILKLLHEKSKEAETVRSMFLSPQKLVKDREKYREKYIKMLGWPLTEYTHEYHPHFEKELVEELSFLKIFRLAVETLPGLWFRGIIFEPVKHSENPPLVILNPGGGYRVEDMIRHGEYESLQYKNIGGRFLEEGAIVYAPQFLLWNDEEHDIEQPRTRQMINAKLKALGGSIAALEIYNVKRSIDYFLTKESIDTERIGMAGLSYGGFYALYISAADQRIKSTFASCFFSDRLSDVPGASRSDWTWNDSAKMFLDAEVAALIAPRALYIENGVKDSLFPYDIAEKEFPRLKSFYEASEAVEKLLFFKSEGAHEVSPTDIGFEFFIRNLSVS